MVDMIMRQLLSKDVLYTPLKVGSPLPCSARCCLAVRVCCMPRLCAMRAS